MADHSGIEWTETLLAPKGGHRTAASRAGLTLSDYLDRLSQGNKYCWKCASWHSRAAFGRDASRWDGLASTCTASRRSPQQRRLPIVSDADRERWRYATDAAYRSERVQRSAARRRGVKVVPREGCESLLEQFGGACAYCGGAFQTWDHIVPVSAGGRTEPGNMLPACKSCNSRKGARDVFDFIQSAGFHVSIELEAALALAVSWGAL